VARLDEDPGQRVGPPARRARRVTRTTGRPRARVAAAARPGPGSTPRLLSLLGLIAATLAAFAGVMRNRWLLLDDPLYVLVNPHVRAGFTLEGVVWFLRHPHGENWHPLTSISHMLDVQLFGLEPSGHHAVSLALHVLNAALLAVVLARLTGAWWRSLTVAALFALHPLRVESVAWVAERKDVLSALFFVVALECYRRWAARPTPGRYALLVVVVALGLMSKPMLVTLPFVLVLLDVWPLERLVTDAAELAPDYPGALNNLGSALGLAGRNDEAVQVFERALREHESADAHFNLAYVEVKLGRLDDAIRECEAGLRLDPGHYESNAQLGMLLAWRGRLDEAIEHLRRALAARPANLETRRLLAQTLERAHRHDEAQAEYAEILHRSPGDRDAQSHLDRRTNP